jgi:tetratricopeptide (TPR) repeat protein
MRTLFAVLFAAILAGCASVPPPPPPPDPLLRDALFAPPSRPVASGDVFALSEPMQRYLKEHIALEVRRQGRQAGLAEALYRRGQLRLDYDATYTRSAAEAFEARSGNCLSLVLMTAAFAKALGLDVRYQNAYLEETWSRSADLLVRSGHINVTLGSRLLDAGTTRTVSALTIDFLPVGEIRGMRVQEIDEPTVVAMYLNNRAVELLAEGQVDEAYWWAREAVRRTPGFAGGYITLGVLYARRGADAPAAAVFARVLEREPDNTQALANQALTYQRLGRHADAAALQRRLARLEAQSPFQDFHLGLAAMKRQDYSTARALFAKEVNRADYYHEFHFWLALANYQLGDHEQARVHLKRAMDASTTRNDRDLYAAKLARLREHGMR